MDKTIQITIPEEILEKAKERGLNIENFKKTLKSFALSDIIARTSKLKSKDADILSKSIKSSAWKKIKKELSL